MTYHSAALAIEDGPLLFINILTSSDTPTYSRYDRGMIEQKEVRSRHLGKDCISLMCRPESLSSPSTAGALTFWIGFHLQQVTTATQQLRGKVLEMAERIEEEGLGDLTLPEIVQVKDCFLRLSAIAEEQDECTQSLASGEQASRAVNFDKVKGYVSVLLTTAGSNDRMLTRIEKRVDDLKQTYDAHQQNKINRRLGLLTIVSAIFLPLSLLSGIFGMNFSVMPALDYEYGYYLCLGGMALILCVLLFGFYRFGWLL
jgi:Mg2+ and Co2+ transporter CorA